MSFVGILTVPFRPLFKKYDESTIFLHLFFRDSYLCFARMSVTPSFIGV